MCTVNFLPRLPSLWLYLACSGSPSGYSSESAQQCRCQDSRAKAHFDSVVGGSRFALAGAVAENIEAPVDSMQLLRDGRVLHDPQLPQLVLLCFTRARSSVAGQGGQSYVAPDSFCSWSS